MSLQFLKAIQVAEKQGLISRRDAGDLTTEYIESELTISMGKVKKAFDAFKQANVL